mmetsp:Transcript_25860/g.103327  ORF Transcript_25860/g.103327 Transcript_25860/m.103327 type:complete len:299 (+) Transcript_25860:1234-2130(+)
MIPSTRPSRPASAPCSLRSSRPTSFMPSPRPTATRRAACRPLRTTARRRACGAVWLIACTRGSSMTTRRPPQDGTATRGTSASTTTAAPPSAARCRIMVLGGGGGGDAADSATSARLLRGVETCRARRRRRMLLFVVLSRDSCHAALVNYRIIPLPRRGLPRYRNLGPLSEVRDAAEPAQCRLEGLDPTPRRARHIDVEARDDGVDRRTVVDGGARRVRRAPDELDLDDGGAFVEVAVAFDQTRAHGGAELGRRGRGGLEAEGVLGRVGVVVVVRGRPGQPVEEGARVRKEVPAVVDL